MLLTPQLFDYERIELFGRGIVGFVLQNCIKMNAEEMVY